MAAIDAHVIPEQLDLFDLLETCATDVCAKLAAKCNDATQKGELHRKFFAGVADVKTVAVRALSEAAGAFIVEDGVLVVAEAPAARLLTVVLNEVGAALDEGRASVEENEIPRLLERVFVGYVLHEVRHRTQGLAKFGSVKILKDVAGPAGMAEYDVLADRDAAWAYAVLYAEDAQRSSFLKAFKEALFFSTNFYFQVYPSASTRPDKVARVMSILFMAARLAARDLDLMLDERKTLPLDAPLLVTLSTTRKMLAIHLGEPSKELLGFADNDDGVGTLMEQIEAGDYEAALEGSISIMSKLSLL